MLDRIPLHKFSFRPNLVMGCDRELIMFSGLMAFSLAFTAMSLLAAIYGACLWIVSLFFLRLMAKADPKMRHVYLRHIRYKHYYPARSTPFRVNTRAYS